MFLLIVYVLVALVFSFICSVAEAVILSVTPVHIGMLEQQGRPSASVLRSVKDDINSTLAAILTLNTIAHTVGAAGAGAQAAQVFGNAYLGIASAVLTLLILVFSEIIPKTLGAHYWRQLAIPTAYLLKWLRIVLYPFVKLSNLLTRGLAEGPTLRGVNRQELMAIAELGEREGALELKESAIIANLFRLRDINVREVLTPRPVVFSVHEELTVDEFFEKHGSVRFSRIPVFRDGHEDVVGFALRSDLLLAKAGGEKNQPVKNFLRKIRVMVATLDLSRAFEQLLTSRAHIALVVDEYGGMAGIVTLEDVLEYLIGEEIVDESDHVTDMQMLAQKLWREKSEKIETGGGDEPG